MWEFSIKYLRGHHHLEKPQQKVVFGEKNTSISKLATKQTSHLENEWQKKATWSILSVINNLRYILKYTTAGIGTFIMFPCLVILSGDWCMHIFCRFVHACFPFCTLKMFLCATYVSIVHVFASEETNVVKY